MQAWMLPFHTDEAPETEYTHEEAEHLSGGAQVLDGIIDNWEGAQNYPEDADPVECLIVAARSFQSEVDLLGIAI